MVANAMFCLEIDPEEFVTACELSNNIDEVADQLDLSQEEVSRGIKQLRGLGVEIKHLVAKDFWAAYAV